MKNIVLSLCLVSGLFAEENSLELLSLEAPRKDVSVAPVPSETMAQQKIDSFFEIDETNSDLFLPEEIFVPVQAPVVDSKNALTEAPQFLEDQSLLNEEDFLDLASLPPPSDDSGIILSNDISSSDEIAALEPEIIPAEKATPGMMIDFGKVFSGSPTIYSFLFLLSVGSFFIWLYTTLSLRTSQILPKNTLKILREKLTNKEFPEALNMCETHNSIVFKMVASGLSCRSQGTHGIKEAVHSEGKRLSGSHWQKIGLLNDIAIIAPMLGLLGTVLGMFYAFYDVNRSMESISAFFDGLGVSVGTTVCGLLVAILAMIFHSMTKYKLVKQLNSVENEAATLTQLIDGKEKA